MSKITPIEGEPFRYNCKSSTSEEIYTIDLLENQGSGSCSCQDWTIRRQFNIKNGEPLHTDKTQCKHCKEAQRHFASQACKFFSDILNSEESTGRDGAMHLTNLIHQYEL